MVTTAVQESSRSKRRMLQYVVTSFFLFLLLSISPSSKRSFAAHSLQNSNPFESKSDQAAATTTGGEKERAAMTAPEGTEQGEKQKVQGGEGKAKMI